MTVKRRMAGVVRTLAARAGLGHGFGVFVVLSILLGSWMPAAATPAADRRIEIAPSDIYGYQVIAEFPHDGSAYTQGLDIHEGVLYEGTGLYGESTLRRVELESGEVLQSIDLEEQYFGEGIVVVNDRIYQLTWQEQTAFVYDRETFELIETFSYTTEGWGLAHDGERLIMSDGTSRIAFRDPETFEETGSIDVTYQGGEVPLLNELEYIDGEIWANVYTTDWIARIDPESGEVTGWIDLTGLLPQEERATSNAEVLNGIALDPDTGQLLVTGKLWPKMYEIELVPPAEQ